MSRRNNFADTLAHARPDKLILDLGGCPLSGMEMPQKLLLDHLGLPPSPHTPPGRIDENILIALDIDTRSVGWLIEPPSALARAVSPTERVDAWGVRRRFTGQYWDIVENPLRGAEIGDLERYPWPDPDLIDVAPLEKEAARAKRLFEDTDYVICGEHPFYGVFELGCWMCGFEDFIVKTALDPDFVHRFFQIILSYQKRVAERYYGLLGGVIHYTSSGDDFATQRAPFISPRAFDELVYPVFAERVAHTKRFTDAKFLHHTCGNASALIPSLVRAGVDILNPIQPCAPDMLPEKLKTDHGSSVVLHGGIDTQELLPRATPGEVAREVAKTVAVLGENGGYIFAAAHNLQSDVPPENIAVLFRAARECYAGQ